MRRATILLAVLAIGCGKGAPPPNPPESTIAAPDAGAASSAPSDAGVAASEADASSSAPAPTPSASASATAPTPEPMTDECAPVAASFEQSLRPKLRKCWLDAANKKPNERIVGTIKFIVEIDGLGKIASAHQVDKSELPGPIVQCMNKAFKAEKIDTGKCTFKTLTLFEKFPR